MEICDWLTNPFTANANKADVACQEELLEIRHDEESKTNFDSSGYMQLWQKSEYAKYIYIRTCGK